MILLLHLFLVVEITNATIQLILLLIIFLEDRSLQMTKERLSTYNCVSITYASGNMETRVSVVNFVQNNSSFVVNI